MSLNHRAVPMSIKAPETKTALNPGTIELAPFEEPI
jgi:hypothetical protein